VDGGSETTDAWVRFVGGVVRDRGTGATWREAAGPPPDEVRDADGATIVPGFVDLHVHGGGGSAFDEGRDAILSALPSHRRHGTTRSVVSLVSAPIDVLCDRLRTIAVLAAEDPRVLGAHLEGPFLSPANRGAHDSSALALPSREAVDRLLDAAAGHLVQVTIAPELPGAIEAIRAFSGAGVTVAVGHTTADARTASAAFDAGATLLTHAFNAMPGIHHRAPGPVVAALRDGRVVLELIADRVHVHPDVLALAFAGAPGRVALVTDAMAAAGASDGDYRLGALGVTVTDGVALLSGSDVLAGSTLTLDAAVRTSVAAGIPLVDAIGAVTTTPARAIGREGIGTLAPGDPADAVLLDDGLAPVEVWIAGVPVP
jgi:N-acetylglucosamine-6-phosphate deacetylase